MIADCAPNGLSAKDADGFDTSNNVVNKKDARTAYSNDALTLPNRVKVTSKLSPSDTRMGVTTDPEIMISPALR